MRKQKKTLPPVISPESSYGELRTTLPTPSSGKKPTITKLKKNYTVVLQKTTECCTLEVFDCGFCLCTREEKYKIFSVELCKVLKSAFYSDGTLLSQEMEIDDLPWWVPLEMAGINRLACVYDKSTGLWFNITHNELAAPGSDPADTIPYQIDTQRLLARLNELMPEASEIGRLRLLGMNDDTISEVIGINRMTFRSRIEKTREILREEFGEAFDW